MSHDYAAECQKWRDVFGHMGTADEIGNEWVRLRDQNEILLRTVETIATGATSIEQCKQLARSVTSTAVHSPDSDMMAVAKAAGYAVSYDHMLDCYFINGTVGWDPRVDDGDALRLAIKLEMMVDTVNRVVAGYLSDIMVEIQEPATDLDVGQHVRTAIFEAALLSAKRKEIILEQ